MTSLNHPTDEDFKIEWFFEPIYEGANSLNGHILIQILDIFVTNASTKQVLDKTIKLAAALVPEGTSNFPENRYFF